MVLKAKVSRRNRADKESALQSVVKEETTRLNALIPKSLHHKLKIQAAQMGNGMTITTILIDALNDHLCKLSNE